MRGRVQHHTCGAWRLLCASKNAPQFFGMKLKTHFDAKLRPCSHFCGFIWHILCVQMTRKRHFYMQYTYSAEWFKFIWDGELFMRTRKGSKLQFTITNQDGLAWAVFPSHLTGTVHRSFFQCHTITIKPGSSAFLHNNGAFGNGQPIYALINLSQARYTSALTVQLEQAKYSF